MSQNILVINPGSTSDDIGYYRDGQPVFTLTMRYSPQELDPYHGKDISEQIPMRKDLILKTLKEYNVPLAEISAVIGRGGLLKFLEGGVYEVNEAMLRDLKIGLNGVHASNLGGQIAHDIAEEVPCKAFIADPVVVDEMTVLAHYTGMPEIQRESIFHALNQKRVARITAEKLGKTYETGNFIVIHAGGGVSVGAHKKGRVVDVTNGYAGEGPIAATRSGAIPGKSLLKMCFSGKYTPEEAFLKMHGKGGLVAHTGTSDFRDLRDYALEGVKRQNSTITVTQEKAKEVIDAMIYQMAKFCGEMAAVLEGKVDAIILTGGMTHAEYLVDELTKKLGWIAPIYVYPGSEEKAALLEACHSALDNPGIVKEYK
ncbi:butyrate kinase [Parelusimicrobium proximum]|uniref:butyrate kinase n=1 Tax=Parelusimicrobium proximum TaxID=3228953 RepID=UPI003D17F2AB